MLGAVAEILKARGSEGWLVGGSVRDRLSGRDSPDLDVAVADDAEQFAKQLSSTLRAPWFSLSERYPTYRVLGPEGHVDLTTVRGAGILADLAERDFTVNAMAVPVTVAAADMSAGKGLAGSLDEIYLMDPFDGAAHLREKRLVAVSDRIFTDDPLRLMRAARFCHTLELDLEAGLLRMIQEQAADVTNTAAERVVNEMCVTLAAGRTADAVRLWDALGLLSAVLPECSGTGTGSSRDGGKTAVSARAWQVKVASLDRLDEVLGDLAGSFPNDVEYLRQRMAEPVDGMVSRPVALRLAGLMQGLEGAEVHTIGHRLKLSGALSSLLVAAARCLGGEDGKVVPKWSAPDLGGAVPGVSKVSREAVLFMWDAASWGPEVVMLNCALDAAATDRDTLDEGLRSLMAFAVRRARGELPVVPVNGESLMRELGLKSGPMLGRALREARLAWESGEATSDSELVEIARRVAVQS